MSELIKNAAANEVKYNDTLVFGNLTGVDAGIILSAIPQSKNVSAGALVEFTCATEESGVTSLVISTMPQLGQTSISDDTLSNGGRQRTLSFIAPSEHSNITIRCGAFRFPDVNETTSILMIQGKIIYQ